MRCSKRIDRTKWARIDLKTLEKKMGKKNYKMRMQRSDPKQLPGPLEIMQRLEKRTCPDALLTHSNVYHADNSMSMRNYRAVEKKDVSGRKCPLEDRVKEEGKGRADLRPEVM
jgi:hypothetical protein